VAITYRTSPGRGLHSSTFQLNLSRFSHKIHPSNPLITPNTPDTSQTSPKQPRNAPPVPHKALTLSRKVDECKTLWPGSTAVQWLRPEQTAGGVHPYLFTQCQVGVYTRPLFGLM